MGSAKYLALLAVLLLAVSLGTVRPVEAAELKKIRVSFLRTFGSMPYLYAERKGYFQREGLEVQDLGLNNGPAAITAVVSGSADIGFAAIVPAILARAEDQPIRVFFTFNYEQYPKPTFTHLIATGHSGITTIGELAGKTVAVNAATSACMLILDDNLLQAGLTSSAVKLLIMPFPQMPAALELGQADAACVVDPFLTAIMQSPKIKATMLASGTLANLKELGRAAQDGYYARPDWLEQNKDTAAGFMRVVIAAAKELVADPALYRKTLMQEFKVPEALADTMQVEINPIDYVPQAADYQAVIDGLTRTKLLAKPLAASDVIFQIKP